jgi:hypothetical protein
VHACCAADFTARSFSRTQHGTPVCCRLAIVADGLLTWPGALTLDVRGRCAARYSFLRRRGRQPSLEALVPDGPTFASRFAGADAGTYDAHRAAFLRLDRLAARWRAAHAL